MADQDNQTKEESQNPFDFFKNKREQWLENLKEANQKIDNKLDQFYAVQKDQEKLAEKIANIEVTLQTNKVTVHTNEDPAKDNVFTKELTEEERAHYIRELNKNKQEYNKNQLHMSLIQKAIDKAHKAYQDQCKSFGNGWFKNFLTSIKKAIVATAQVIAAVVSKPFTKDQALTNEQVNALSKLEVLKDQYEKENSKLEDKNTRAQKENIIEKVVDARSKNVIYPDFNNSLIQPARELADLAIGRRQNMYVSLDEIQDGKSLTFLKVEYSHPSPYLSDYNRSNGTLNFYKVYGSIDKTGHLVIDNEKTQSLGAVSYRDGQIAGLPASVLNINREMVNAAVMSPNIQAAVNEYEADRVSHLYDVWKHEEDKFVHGNYDIKGKEEPAPQAKTAPENKKDEKSQTQAKTNENQKTAEQQNKTKQQTQENTKETKENKTQEKALDPNIKKSAKIKSKSCYIDKSNKDFPFTKEGKPNIQIKYYKTIATPIPVLQKENQEALQQLQSKYEAYLKLKVNRDDLIDTHIAAIDQKSGRSLGNYQLGIDNDQLKYYRQESALYTGPKDINNMSNMDRDFEVSTYKAIADHYKELVQNSQNFSPEEKKAFEKTYEKMTKTIDQIQVVIPGGAPNPEYGEQSAKHFGEFKQIFDKAVEDYDVFDYSKVKNIDIDHEQKMNEEQHVEAPKDFPIHESEEPIQEDEYEFDAQDYNQDIDMDMGDER